MRQQTKISSQYLLISMFVGMIYPGISITNPQVTFAVTCDKFALTATTPLDLSETYVSPSGGSTLALQLTKTEDIMANGFLVGRSQSYEGTLTATVPIEGTCRAQGVPLQSVELPPTSISYAVEWGTTWRKSQTLDGNPWVLQLGGGGVFPLRLPDDVPVSTLILAPKETGLQVRTAPPEEVLGTQNTPGLRDISKVDDDVSCGYLWMWSSGIGPISVSEAGLTQLEEQCDSGLVLEFGFTSEDLTFDLRGASGSPTPTPPPTGNQPTEQFNGPLVFDTPIENATKPSCGCSGESTYNQGISIAAEDPCPKCETIGGFSGITQDAGMKTVFLHNGEFFHRTVDLEIPGRGFNWKFERKYRSGVTFDGPLGHNWEFNYNRRLFVGPNGSVMRMDGNARADEYTLNSDGTFSAPAGFYTQLVNNPDGTFIERDRTGTTVTYSPPNANGMAHMMQLTDRNGNSIEFVHNSTGQLIQVIDTLGRLIDYRYNSEGRLIEVADFFNRSIQFEYDTNGDLVAVTSPSVTDTPNGNDFPEGKTARYTYSSGFPEERLNHNLLTITAPNEVANGGPPRVVLAYDTDPTSPHADRVLTQAVGGTNLTGIPAGDTIRYEYDVLEAAPANDVITPVMQTTVTDRNGNITEYRFNHIATIVRIREFTNRAVRPGDPEFFETRYEYNKDGEMTRMIYPEGNAVEYVYDDQNPDRFQQGNLLAETHTPDPERGGDQALLMSSETYEPMYNHMRTMVEPRGNDPDFVPQNGGVTSPERYTTLYTFDYQEGENFSALAQQIGITEAEVRALLTQANIPMGLGDVNGDGRTNQIAGNVIRTEAPTVHLLQDSKMARLEGGTDQPIVELRTYNQFGQIKKDIDPEGNVTTYKYYPENDPDGDGEDLTSGIGAGKFGYLKRMIRDAKSDPIRNSGKNPKPTKIRTQYVYDRVGNVIRRIDGRGIATDYVVNELNQVVQTFRATAHDLFAPTPPEPLPLIDFQYLARMFYDFNDNVVRSQIEDRGNTSSVGGDNAGSGTAFVDYEYVYDILDNQIEMSEEVGDSEDLITLYRYDPNENRVLVIQPEANATSYTYDERDLQFQHTRGDPSPPPLALLASDDPTDYDVRDGIPSTMTYHYDRNRNLIETVDATDTDGSPANNSTIAGDGDRMRYIYDGFDRKTSDVDSVGNQSVYQYDPASNLVRVSRFGPVGGASPVSDGPTVLPMPVSSLGVIQNASLMNADLLKATETLYDELNRAIQADRVLFVSTIETVGPPEVADGADDIGKKNLTPGDDQGIPGISVVSVIGRVTTRTEYDRKSRPTFTIEDDGDTSHTFYDGVDRVIKTKDPEKNIVETAYDDNDNVIEVRDTDKSQVPGPSKEKFLTTYFYDSLNRLQKKVDNIGQTFDYRYDSRDNPVAMADAQGPVTGATITRRAFSTGTLTVDDVNDFGNVTLYSYDGINRKTQEDMVLTASGEGDGANIGANIFGIKTTTPTPDLTQSGGDGLMTVRYEWDKNTLQASLTDDNGNQTQYTYDNLNRRLTETTGICVPPLLTDRCDEPTTITYAYDPDDNVFRMTDENGSVRECDFDAINRPIACNIDRAPGVVGTMAETYEYDGLSRITQATDDNEPADSNDDSVMTYAYDSLSRVIEETQQIGELPAKAISSAWRAANLRSALTYPNSRALDYTYDRLDRLDTVADQGAAQPIADYDYLGTWRVAERAYPINETRMTYLNDAGTADQGYDGLRRAVQLRHLRADNSLVVGFTHTYDRMNNKVNEEKLHATGDSELYRYDSVYRLVKFDRGTLTAAKDALTVSSANVPLHSQWALDGVGNWQQVDAEVREHSSFNEITVRNNGVMTDILSDDNGNETDNGTFVFEWDYKNRLHTVTRKADGALIAVYSYDANNRRIRKVVTNSDDLNETTDYYYDGSRVLEERDAADNIAQQYVYGNDIDEPLMMNRNLDGDSSTTGSGDQALFYHQNTLQAVFALTDETGADVEGYHYDAYGRQTVFTPSEGNTGIFNGESVSNPGGASGHNNPYLYTGRRLDPETGMYYYRKRYMNTDEGRFISRDPVKSFRPRGINLYQYALGNPGQFSDPMGNIPLTNQQKLDILNYIPTPGHRFITPGIAEAFDKIKARKQIYYAVAPTGFLISPCRKSENAVQINRDLFGTFAREAHDKYVKLPLKQKRRRLISEYSNAYFDYRQGFIPSEMYRRLTAELDKKIDAIDALLKLETSQPTLSELIDINGMSGYGLDPLQIQMNPGSNRGVNEKIPPPTLKLKDSKPDSLADDVQGIVQLS